MKRSLYILYLFVPVFFLAPAGCKELYKPSVKSTNNVYLVVDGFINNGVDSTVISLSHTFKLDDSAKISYELGAQVYVEDQTGGQFVLPEIGAGRYGVPQLSLNPASLYRLHIKTSLGKEYVSEYEPLKPSPPIDSVNWVVDGTGCHIFANTHDPQNNTHYYRWEYQETWEFHPFYETHYRYINHQVVPMLVDTIYTCYQYFNSSNLMLSSTARLSNDLVYEQPMVFIPQMDWRLDVRYSILVKEYALTKEAFDYWTALQKNTEQLGTVFGPLPSDVKGNLHNLHDSSEEVVGFVGFGAVASKRIFITYATDLFSLNWHQSVLWSNCMEKTTPNNPDSLEIYFGQGSYVPVQETTPPGSGYNYTTRFCADCTLLGSNHKPAYWP